MRIKGISAVFFLIMLASAMNSKAEISNRVVAIVNKDVITLYELNNRIKEQFGKTTDTLKAQNEESFIETRRQVLETMIDEKIAQENIQELGLHISQDDIDSYIENIKKANNLTQEDLIAHLTDEGITLEAYKTSIKERLERSQLYEYEVSSKAVILEGQLSKYYQDHIDEYKEEELVQIAAIFLTVQNEDNKEELTEVTKKGEKILDRINGGEDFSALAKEFSNGPGADEGGELGEINITQIDPSLKKIISGLSEGGVSKLITSSNGVEIIKLIKRKGGATKPFDQVKNEIYETIYNSEVDKRYTSWIKELRDKTFTKINF